MCVCVGWTNINQGRGGEGDRRDGNGELAKAKSEYDGCGMVQGLKIACSMKIPEYYIK